jgi:hypothetical protein
MSEPSAIRFPMACPECSAVSAMPYMAIAQADGVTSVGMRCKQCNHDWRFELPRTAETSKMRSGVRLPLVRTPGQR